MDICKRFFRRPFTTALWGLLVMGMALLLCTGGALWYSSENMVTTLDGMYTAAAFRTNKAVIQEGDMTRYNEKHLMQEDVDFLESLDSVENIYFHTLTGAYSPVFLPELNPSGNQNAISNDNQGYDDVILIGTLSSEGPTKPNTMDLMDLTALGLTDQEKSWGFSGSVRVEQVIRCHEDYQILEGANLNLYVSGFGVDLAEFFQLNGRYIICADIQNGLDLHCGQIIPEEDKLRNTRFVYSSLILADGEEQVNVTNIEILPGIEVLEGSWEDFLADPDNREWQDYIEVWDKAHHSVPVLGTDNLESMYGFLNGDVSIIQGRSFTPEEYASGARVCIISENMALASGLGVGDTVSLSQFHITEFRNSSLEGAYLGISSNGYENNPTIGEFEAGTEFVTENEEFTVIGIYRKANAWDQGAWSFTVNTVLIPKSAQIPGGYGGVSTLEVIPMAEKFPGSGLTGNVNEYTDRGNYGIYLSVLLKKGCMQEFMTALENTSLYGEFFAEDQGYEAMIGSVRDVGEASRKLLAMTAGGWALLLALYVLLYQGGQRKNLGTMRSLGAGARQVRSYLFGSGILLSSVGVGLGTLISGLVIRKVNAELLAQMLQITEKGQFSAGKGLDAQTIGAMISGSQLPLWAMAVLMAVQIGIFAIVLWAQADSLSRRKPRTLLGV